MMIRMMKVSMMYDYDDDDDYDEFLDIDISKGLGEESNYECL